MNVIQKESIVQILESIDAKTQISYIENAFTNYSNNKAIVPPVGHLKFEDPPGDLHIKYGYIKEDDVYVIKIATGFYKNPSLGLSSSNGLNLVFNQKNGLLNAILSDEGHLTDVRTALAGAVAAKHLRPDTMDRIGIIGTGIQARLQLEHLAYITDCKDVLVWGRNEMHLETYIQEFRNRSYHIATASPQEISDNCDLIVCCTASNDPIVPRSSQQKDQLIIAMGADTIGKQELDFEVLVQASLIVMDSTSQCQDHGEIHKAYGAGLLEKTSMRELGNIISDNDFQRPKGLIVADLTGIATQDIQISKLILNHIAS